MNSFSLHIDPREEQYARYIAGLLSMLKEAVNQRVADGVSQTEIAERIDMHKSSLSRILNGRVTNLTARTISDILWATEHEPDRPSADPIEDISHNYCPIHKREAPTLPTVSRLSMDMVIGGGLKGPTQYTVSKTVELVQ